MPQKQKKNNFIFKVQDNKDRIVEMSNLIEDLYKLEN